MSGASERAKGIASGPLLTSGPGRESYSRMILGPLELEEVEEEEKEAEPVTGKGDVVEY